MAVTTEAFVPSYSMPVHEVQGWLTVCLSQDITKKVAVLCGTHHYAIYGIVQSNYTGILQKP